MKPAQVPAQTKYSPSGKHCLSQDRPSLRSTSQQGTLEPSLFSDTGKAHMESSFMTSEVVCVSQLMVPVLEQQSRVPSPSPSQRAHLAGYCPAFTRSLAEKRARKKICFL